MIWATSLLALLPSLAAACDSCYGPTDFIEHERLVRRIQPGVEGAINGPKADLEWGTLNFLHTTDTHGWLEGHLKEQNYGADWGDFVSFSKDMKKKAKDLKVDLLLVDTGDLHDGAGLSDATSPNGQLSNPIFEKVDYDLLTIGNHELYVSDIAYETFNQFAKHYGDKYLTSNVQIINPATGQYEYIGKQYRYFTTDQGYRIMAFGVLFDFTGNSNVSKVIKAADLVTQQWFIDAVNTPKPVDLFLLIGHNAIRGSSSTVNTIYRAIRAARPTTPIQIFGGHTHIRDFAVYDSMTTGLESGRYCETLGWLAMQGISSSHYHGSKKARNVPQPKRQAIKGNVTTSTSTSSSAAASSTSTILYSRRYLDWNRQTFAYHAIGSQNSPKFDTSKGLKTSKAITADRTELNLTSIYGCAPQTWCQSCAPFMSSGNIFSLLSKALAATVINPARSTKPRLIIINTGSIRFDLVQGPFTFDDSFIVSPFDDAFQYIPDVPYSQAKQLLTILNNGAYQKRDSEPSYLSNLFDPETACQDPTIGSLTSPELLKRSTRGHIKRQTTTISPGYTTSDDFGTDGDDTIHSPIPYYYQPNDLQANASFPTNGSLPTTVDLVFLDYIGANYIIPALTKVGANYTKADFLYYMPQNFTTNSYLPLYAKITPEWQVNLESCTVGKGVGY